jgi:hypothetical protein
MTDRTLHLTANEYVVIRSHSPDAFEVEGHVGPGRLAHQPGRPNGSVVRDPRLGRQPGPLDYGVYLTEYRDVFRLAGPQPLVLGAVRVLGAVGRLFGKRA